MKKLFFTIAVAITVSLTCGCADTSIPHFSNTVASTNSTFYAISNTSDINDYTDVDDSNTSDTDDWFNPDYSGISDSLCNTNRMIPTGKIITIAKKNTSDSVTKTSTSDTDDWSNVDDTSNNSNHIEPSPAPMMEFNEWCSDYARYRDTYVDLAYINNEWTVDECYMTWDGHIYSIDSHGYLWFDDQQTENLVDIPEWKFNNNVTVVGRRSEGTYIIYSNLEYNWCEFQLWNKCELIATSEGKFSLDEFSVLSSQNLIVKASSEDKKYTLTTEDDKISLVCIGEQYTTAPYFN